MLLYGPPKSSERKAESLFEYVARQNGPLPDYHPQMLLQCLLWGMLSLLCDLAQLKIQPEKIELVKEIIVNLAKDIQSLKSWRSVPVERFFSKDQSVSECVVIDTARFELYLQKIAHKKRYTMLFDGPQEDEWVVSPAYAPEMSLTLCSAKRMVFVVRLSPNSSNASNPDHYHT